MKLLYCSDAGFECKAVISANTEEEILKQASIHAKEVHGVEVTPELTGYLKKLIREEADEKRESV